MASAEKDRLEYIAVRKCLNVFIRNHSEDYLKVIKKVYNREGHQGFIELSERLSHNRSIAQYLAEALSPICFVEKL